MRWRICKSRAKTAHVTIGSIVTDKRWRKTGFTSAVSSCPVICKWDRVFDPRRGQQSTFVQSCLEKIGSLRSNKSVMRKPAIIWDLQATVVFTWAPLHKLPSWSFRGVVSDMYASLKVYKQPSIVHTLERFASFTSPTTVINLHPAYMYWWKQSAEQSLSVPTTLS